MAEVITEDIEAQTTSALYSVRRIALVGVILGVFYWVIVSLLGVFVDSAIVCGDIATILVATLGVIIMLRLRMSQPLIVALASGLSLWGLASWTSGLLWIEIIAWNILLYGLAYTLFSWVSRYNRVVPVLMVITLIIIAVRITITL